MNMPIAPTPHPEHLSETFLTEAQAADFVACHELLDRTGVAADIVEKYVHAHPNCARHDAWLNLAEQAITALHELGRQIAADQLAAATLRQITPCNDELRALASKLPPPAKWLDADEPQPFN